MALQLIVGPLLCLVELLVDEIGRRTKWRSDRIANIGPPEISTWISCVERRIVHVAVEICVPTLELDGVFREKAAGGGVVHAGVIVVKASLRVVLLARIGVDGDWQFALRRDFAEAVVT